MLKAKEPEMKINLINETYHAVIFYMAVKYDVS